MSGQLARGQRRFQVRACFGRRWIDAERSAELRDGIVEIAGRTEGDTEIVVIARRPGRQPDGRTELLDRRDEPALRQVGAAEFLAARHVLRVDLDGPREFIDRTGEVASSEQ